MDNPVPISDLRARLEYLEHQGITELTGQQVHDWVFHDYYGNANAIRWQLLKAYVYYATPIFLVGCLCAWIGGM